MEQAEDMNKRRNVGFVLMLSCSIFFILGSFWYTRLAYVGKDLWPQLSIGLTVGIPAIIIMTIAWLHSKVGGIIAICLAFPASLFWLVQILVGDNEPRLIWSLFISSTIYLAGAIIVLMSTRRGHQ